MSETRNLVFILGDQLDPAGPAFDGFDRTCDRVIMAEVAQEIHRYPNHRQRVVLFLSAMRHFCEALREEDIKVDYQKISDADPAASLDDFLQQQINRHNPAGIVLTQPGRYDLELSFRQLAENAGTPIDIRQDTHFFCTHAQFDDWAKGRKSLVMEYFYREMRKKTGYLMEDGKPAGGAWNFDKKNRGAFDSNGPGLKKDPIQFKPDRMTRQVIQEVHQLFPDLYGETEHFIWPVTPAQAQEALDDFIAHRLPDFGTYQDAMWTGEAFLYHSCIAAAINLKLLNPRRAIEAALEAWDAGKAPINAVEGFVRQILGWREFIRGVYWLTMPNYAAGNALKAEKDLPDFFWTGETRMHCISQVVKQLLKYGYAHHIQRLMVTGLFTLLYGVSPGQVHDWYMAMFVDSIEWVTMPNTIGMSQYADGGTVGTKPYVASGKYINRMSNYCDGCAYNPNEAIGESACPFTTLYWDFLSRHQEILADNHRMGFQLRNLKNKDSEEMKQIFDRADAIRQLIAKEAL